MRPTRSLPRVGLRVTVRHLAHAEEGTVVAVQQGGRSVVVETDAGETIAFVLNPGTAAYRAPGSGPRLTWDDA